MFDAMPSLLYEERESAVRCAAGFAVANGVRAWYTDDGKKYEPISSDSA